jgi:hypothetical protein
MKKKMILMLILALLICTLPVMAKVPRNGKHIDREGNVFIMRHGKPRTGWFRYHGKWYYGHRTNSRLYPKGSCTAGEFRFKGRKLYYFNNDGTKLTHSTEFIALNRHSTSVKYIRSGRMTRYNVKRRRYQWLNPNTRKWQDLGMQCLPYGSLDEQP